MGFSDRFKDAAEAARTSLQDRGLGTAGTIRGIQSLERPDDDLAAAARARSRGAPDAYSLITHDEVVALTGLPVGGPYLSWTDDDIGDHVAAAINEGVDRVLRLVLGLGVDVGEQHFAARPH